MKRLWLLLVCTAFFGLGCGSQWDEFWRDLRGDNQKMRSDYPSASGTEEGSKR
jgi:hypothetical protein